MPQNLVLIFLFMTTNSLSPKKNHQQYRIVAECSIIKTQIALAGFSADEQTETILLRHLHNLCVQSDGSLTTTHSLVHNMMQQWQTVFNIRAVQLLQYIHYSDNGAFLKSVCLYKTIANTEEKLINRILL